MNWRKTLPPGLSCVQNASLSHNVPSFTPTGMTEGTIILTPCGSNEKFKACDMSSLFSSPNTNAIMNSVDKRYYGIALSTVGTMSLAGMMLSLNPPSNL